MGKRKTIRQAVNTTHTKGGRSAKHNANVRTKKNSLALIYSQPTAIPNFGLKNKVPTTTKGIKKHLRRQAHALREQAQEAKAAKDAITAKTTATSSEDSADVLMQ